MLNHNIIGLILKKAGKCHCWKDSFKDYCFDHTNNEDDYLYMTINQYIDIRERLPQYVLQRTIELNKGRFVYSLDIIKITRNSIHLKAETTDFIHGLFGNFIFIYHPVNNNIEYTCENKKNNIYIFLRNKKGKLKNSSKLIDIHQIISKSIKRFIDYNF